MASQTDGEAVLNTNDVSGAMQKVFRRRRLVLPAELLLDATTKLDGRFRRIRVEVKRHDVDVRARPGYLAPTESGSARRRRGDRPAPARKPAPPPTVTRALDALAPARGNLPVRVQAVGGRSSIRAIVELDAATAKQPEWLSGGTLRLTFEPERITGSSAVGAVADADHGDRTRPAQHRHQRQRAAAGGGPIRGPRGVDAAQRPACRSRSRRSPRCPRRPRRSARAASPRGAARAPGSPTWRPPIRDSAAPSGCASRCRWPAKDSRAPDAC